MQLKKYPSVKVSKVLIERNTEIEARIEKRRKKGNFLNQIRCFLRPHYMLGYVVVVVVVVFSF